MSKNSTFLFTCVFAESDLLPVSCNHFFYGMSRESIDFVPCRAAFWCGSAKFFSTSAATDNNPTCQMGLWSEDRLEVFGGLFVFK